MGQIHPLESKLSYVILYIIHMFKYNLLSFFILTSLPSPCPVENQEEGGHKIQIAAIESATVPTAQKDTSSSTNADCIMLMRIT